MKRAALYARYSSDRQNDRSVDDQLAAAHELCEREGWTVVGVFADRALSGSSAVNRPDFMGMMTAAAARKFDLIVVEEFDRLFRDQEDYHHYRKRLEYADVGIVTFAGAVGRLDGSLRALMSEMFIDNLRVHVRRGQRARIGDGLAAGGKCYGYRPVAGKPGAREIVAEEAAVIRRIFADYLSGMSPRAIAHALNAESVPAPRGRQWQGSTINGSGQRGNGILRNPLYAGRLVWNRVSMISPPEPTKRAKPLARPRLSRPNKPSEWVVREVPDLAIVSKADFEAVQRRKKELSHIHPGKQKRPRRMLSGLLRCGSCGGGLSMSGADSTGRTRLRCTSAKEGGHCPDPHTFYLETIENAVLGRLRGELAHPQAIAEFVRAYHEEHRRLAARAGSRRAGLEHRIGETGREIARLVDAIAKGHGDTAVLGPRANEITKERESLQAELAALEQAPTVIALHPAALKRYEETVARLQRSIAAAHKAGDNEAAEAMRDLIESVTVVRNGKGDIEIVIAGRLNALVGIPTFPSGHLLCPKVVAGERYGQKTQLNSLRFELCAVA